MLDTGADQPASATLTLSSALPANMALTDVRTLRGFELTLSHVRHTVAKADAVGMFAIVATDASGNIANWRLIIKTGGLDNGRIAMQNAQFISDSGTLRCCDPTVSGCLASNSNLAGTWTSGNPTPTPAAAVTNLKNMVASSALALTTGQVSSLTDKLNRALASIQAGAEEAGD